MSDAQITRVDLGSQLGLLGCCHEVTCAEMHTASQVGMPSKLLKQEEEHGHAGVPCSCAGDSQENRTSAAAEPWLRLGAEVLKNLPMWDARCGQDSFHIAMHNKHSQGRRREVGWKLVRNNTHGYSSSGTSDLP